MDLLTGENDQNRRLDRVLRKALPDYPLPLIHRLLRKGAILVDGKPGKAQDRVNSGVKITIPKPDLSFSRPLREKKEKEPVNSKLKLRFYHPPEILWEGLGLIAFNKPVGLAVHGPVSLERMALASLTGKLPPSLSFKPGPMHRLDKPSSGIVIFSASLEGAQLFTTLMQDHKITKTYLAIVEGTVEEKHFWTDYLVRDKEKKKTFVVGENSNAKDTEEEDAKNVKKSVGKISITKVIPLATMQIKAKHYTLIEAEIETGRTHQIRAQSAYHGFPLAGDRKYGGHTDDIFKKGFFLHAWKMEFSLSDDENVKITAPLPAEFQRLVDEEFNNVSC